MQQTSALRLDADLSIRGLGFLASSSFGDETVPKWIFIVAGALIVGMLAAIFGDKFWYAIKGWWGW
jgi:hypothetical protein